jgi:hypothetical protein
MHTEEGPAHLTGLTQHRKLLLFVRSKGNLPFMKASRPLAAESYGWWDAIRLLLLLNAVVEKFMEMCKNESLPRVTFSHRCVVLPLHYACCSAASWLLCQGHERYRHHHTGTALPCQLLLPGCSTNQHL